MWQYSLFTAEGQSVEGMQSYQVSLIFVEKQRISERWKNTINMKMSSLVEEGESAQEEEASELVYNERI